MKPKVNRRTVDLSGHPNLVVIYLGMRVNTLTGLKTLLGFWSANLEVGRSPARWFAPAREFVVGLFFPRT